MIKQYTFSKRLQYLIDVKNIIPADLVRDKIGNAAQISKWLSGSTKTPSLRTLNRLSAYFNCDKGWLSDGTGDPFGKVQMARVGYAALKEQGIEKKVVMTIEPGPARKKGDIKKEEQQTRQETEGIDEEEAIEQTRYILRSDTVYRSALHSNIRAFYQGVKREEEMAGVDEQMIEMQNKMDMMMQMMESLGAHLPGKKREEKQG